MLCTFPWHDFHNRRNLSTNESIDNDFTLYESDKINNHKDKIRIHIEKQLFYDGIWYKILK